MRLRMQDRRVRQALRDALNGDADTVDPAVRRGLTVLAVASDDIEDRARVLDERHHARVEKIAAKVDSLTAAVDALRRVVYGAMSLVVAALVAFATDNVPKL